MGCSRWDGGGGGGGGGNGGLVIYGEGVRVQSWRLRDGRLMTRIIENGFIGNIFFFEEWTVSFFVHRLLAGGLVVHSFAISSLASVKQHSSPYLPLLSPSSKSIPPPPDGIGPIPWRGRARACHSKQHHRRSRGGDCSRRASTKPR